MNENLAMGDLIKKLEKYLNKINDKDLIFPNIVVDDDIEYGYNEYDFEKIRFELNFKGNNKIEYLIKKFSDEYCKILLNFLSKDEYIDKFIVINQFEFHSSYRPSNNAYDNCLIAQIYIVDKPKFDMFKLQ